MLNGISHYSTSSVDITIQYPLVTLQFIDFFSMAIMTCQILTNKQWKNWCQTGVIVFVFVWQIAVTKCLKKKRYLEHIWANNRKSIFSSSMTKRLSSVQLTGIHSQTVSKILPSFVNWKSSYMIPNGIMGLIVQWFFMVLACSLFGTKPLPEPMASCKH